MTHIWVPKVGILEGEAAFTAGRIEGEYTIRKFKAPTGELVQEIGPFSNLITNIGLNRAGTAATGNYCFVGTGTVPPAVTNTQMGNFLGSTSTLSTGWGITAYGPAPQYWCQTSGTFRFDAGAATGNLTEVGIGWSTSGLPDSNTNRVFSRALIVDGSGNPVTITVLPAEYLDVTYSIRNYPYIGADLVQTVSLSGVPYTFESRALSVGTVNWGANLSQRQSWGRNQALYTGTAAGTPPSLAAVTDNYLINDGASENIPSTSLTYIDGSFTSSATLNAGLSEGNLAYGIRGMRVVPADSSSLAFLRSCFQTTISPAIPKNNTNILSFGVSVSWGRYTP